MKNQAPPSGQAILDQCLANLKAFGRFNAQRIDSVRNRLPESKRDVFDLIPFLLNEDDPGLPGNAIIEVPPAGISCFECSPALKNTVKRRFPDFVFRQRARATLPVSFLAVIGSAGTLAFTGKSDIDFWVGMDARRAGGEILEAFEAKFREIEAWAMREAGLEVHFFTADVERIRNEDYGGQAGESCGSALARLLKDEFYRTAIFLQGKKPFFWAFPPGLDNPGYADRLSALERHPAFPHEYYVDLGHVHSIEPAEVTGAALWHILKSLSSPFKSVIKIALLDQVLMQGGAVRPLCDRFKEVLLKSPDAPPDPYVFMMESVREFYNGLGLTPVSRLLEECFFIKGLLTADIAEGGGGERAAAFLDIGLKWGRSREEMTQFSRFGDWDMAQTSNLRSRIVAYILDTYKRIRARTQDETALISQEDLSVIGRKLRTFFDRRAGKIPFEFMLIGPNEILALSVEERPDGAGGSLWHVRAHTRGSTRAEMHTLHIAADPWAALAWIALNRVYRDRHHFMVKAPGRLSTTDAQEFLTVLRSAIPMREVGDLDSTAVKQPFRFTHLFILLNYHRPERHHSVASILVFSYSSHGELFCESHTGVDTVRWFLEQMLSSKVGRENLKALKWSVHRPKGHAGLHRLCGVFEEEMRRFIER